MLNGVLTALERVSLTGRWRRSSVIGPDQEGPSCLEWGSSQSRRTGPAGCQSLLIRGQRVRLGGQKTLSDVRREIKTHCVGRVSFAKLGTEKVRLSGREALAGVQLEIKTHGIGQVRQKGKVVWSGGSRRHPTGDQYSRHRMGEPRRL
ncbi:hypothetical protein G5714_008088 [Onychostoma macrolepis]|uniref:Uncharacterized protein n=1 Tax=Onychostoma macrolepis TaxID=369639 RepID=A0A7J6CUN4_9TELE|nr:hypothetical protein G5714_008088 [Onychostoma macrolepis]